MEQPIPGDNHLPPTADTITLPIKPFEIRTVEVFYPSAGNHPEGQGPD